MDFMDEETRPRFLFKSRPAAASSADADSPSAGVHNKPVIFASISLSFLLLASSIFFFQTDLLRSIAVWLSLSLLLGPFAPPSFTGGDVRVGCGDVVEFPPTQEDPAPADESKRRRQKVKRSDDLGLGTRSSSNLALNGMVSGRSSDPAEDPGLNSGCDGVERKKDSRSKNGDRNVVEEKEWTDEDVEFLRKQILKNPVGKPRRWEVITEAFKGRHGLQSVIKMSKSMGEAKPEDSDSYSKFLRNRKPVDKRVEDEIAGESANAGGDGEGLAITWSSAEDIALLNALKAFPKDVPMRWEKIAISVPGKSKAACVKRVAELKKGFRSSKAADSADN